MAYEIDFIGVGKDSSKSGDAIAIRYGNLTGSRSEFKVVVIDGGFKASGTDLVEHIKQHYGTEKVDLVISTHPDQDHINGLSVVLDELEVTELWIHKAWDHNEGLADKFHDGRITDSSIGEKLRDNLQAAHDLVEQAKKLGITVNEPFTNLTFDGATVKVLGPTQDYFESLIPDFDGMPKKAEEEKDIVDEAIDGLAALAKSAWKAITAFWGDDDLPTEDKTSAKNNSSVITQIITDDRRLMFTGDAGITALEQAADQLDGCINPAELRFMQVPHHGSRRNISSNVLDRIIGEPVSNGETKNIVAYASTARDGEPKHPRKAVMNAFTHRGVKTVATRGRGICSSYNAPDREGWSSVKAEPYHYEYQEEA
ncbi:MBL fold metallo-hydrolase [Neiella sp. HB171785]|uniref:MBL fold metallo-hydrolase n=1 Tax=Neiella litorisoli TaxID=2771431 RepID=A0A8J6UFN1_9GAMM|nr:MBL fold metallo-hydrolase [Neiella litorisoli]MBD1388981.1 MBL fold metallo-hydrolase [Neiella litorisoli]